MSGLETATLRIDRVAPLGAWWREVNRLAHFEPGSTLALVVTDALSGLAMLAPPLALAVAALGVVHGRPVLEWVMPLVAVALLVAVLRALRGALAARLMTSLCRRLTTEVYDSVERMTPSLRAVLPDGSVAQLVAEDTPSAAVLVTTASSVLSSLVVLLVASAVIVAVFPPQVVAACLVGVVASVLVTLRTDVEAIRWGRLAYLKKVLFVADATTALSHRMLNEVRLLAVEDSARASFQNALAAMLAPLRRHLRLLSARDASLGALLGWGAAGVAVVAMWSAGGTDATRVLWVVFLLRALEGPLAALAQARSVLLMSNIALSRLAAIRALGQESRRSRISGSQTLEGLRTDASQSAVLAMEAVAFAYPKVSEVPMVLRPPHLGPVGSRDTMLLSDITLDLVAGHVAAIVGPSGSGKSTLAQLAAGLLCPDRGRVLVCGRDTRFRPGADVNLITSQPWLADTSVLDNVWLAAPDAQIEQVVEACSSVGLDIVTRNWGSGLGGGVGPGGGLLSSGERQRVAIARAMLKRPRLLILDEGTSALDVASEREIWATLRAALPETAILVISHRLATAQLAPTIFVLDAGRIITTDKGEIVSQTTPFRNLFGVV